MAMQLHKFAGPFDQLLKPTFVALGFQENKSLKDDGSMGEASCLFWKGLS